MTDIVERLRDCSKYGAYQQGQPGRLMGEAADEIERLRIENERLRALALAFLDCQTDENAEALRRALEPKP